MAKGWKPYWFSISKKQWHPHHPNKELYPGWVMDLPASLHHVVSACAEMETTDPNLAILRSFIDALDWIYLDKRRELDEEEVKHGSIKGNGD